MRDTPMKLRWWIVGYVIALGVAVFAPLASGSPDGLERVAEDEEFIEVAEDPSYEIIPDYVVPGMGNEQVATILAGWMGVTILFLVVGGLAYLANSRKRADSAPGSP